MATTYVVFSTNPSDPSAFILGVEVPQGNGLVTVERLWDAPEPQPEGGTKLSRVLSVQEDGAIGWRPQGTNGPFELASKSQGFYLYAPGVRLHGNLRDPIFPIARFEGFIL